MKITHSRDWKWKKLAMMCSVRSKQQQPASRRNPGCPGRTTPVPAGTEPVLEEEEPPREIELADVLDSLNAMQNTLERMTTLFAGMVEIVTEVSTGITELSAASASASAAAGDGKSSGPVNPVVLKLAIQAAMTAAIPELSKMLRGQIAAVKTDLQAAAEEDARIVGNNRKTVEEYAEHRKNIIQEV